MAVSVGRENPPVVSQEDTRRHADSGITAPALLPVVSFGFVVEFFSSVSHSVVIHTIKGG